MSKKLLKSSGIQPGTLAQILSETVAGLSGKVSNGVVLDDDSAASNGTDVMVVFNANGVDAYLESTLANNASVLCDVGNNGAAGPKIPIFDNNSPSSVALYFDENAPDRDQRFLVVNPLGVDVFVKLTDGSKLRLVHDPLAAAIAQVETFTTRADASDDLDGTYILLNDEDGSVAVWIDTDNSGTTIPTGASAADRALECTGIATDDTAAAVATAIASTINADSKFAASAVGAVVTVTHATAGAVADGEDGDATFTAFTVTTNGSDANGIAVHCDDNAAVLYNRLLFISPTNTDGVFATTNAAPLVDAVWPSVTDATRHELETGA